MIKTKEDFWNYLSDDQLVYGSGRSKPKKFGDIIWRFMILLRKEEYYTNCLSKFPFCILRKYYRFKRMFLGYFLGFEIPINTLDGGVKINHTGLLIINSRAHIGRFSQLSQGCTIGQDFSGGVPRIGKNVWIGPCVTIVGDITIADGIVIGGNSFVNKSFYKEDISIGGIPAKVIGSVSNPYRVEL